MKLVDITWDAAGEAVGNLPREIEVPYEVYKGGCYTDELIEWALDEYGFCINSCSIKAQ